jgi:hypothetical protein
MFILTFRQALFVNLRAAQENSTFHSPDGDRALAYVAVPTHSKLPYALPCRSNATPARAQQQDANSAASRCLEQDAAQVLLPLVVPPPPPFLGRGQ